MPGSQKSLFLATNRDFGNLCNAALALILGWILGQLKWEHMLITGLIVAAILLGLQIYRYEYARRHPLVEISGSGSSGTPRAGPQPPGDARTAREQHARAVERQRRLRGLAPRITLRTRPEAELMPRSEALRQTLGLSEKADTVV
jgi:hypothetical protein